MNPTAVFPPLEYETTDWMTAATLALECETLIDGCAENLYNTQYLAWRRKHGWPSPQQLGKAVRPIQDYWAAREVDPDEHRSWRRARRAIRRQLAQLHADALTASLRGYDQIEQLYHLHALRLIRAYLELGEYEPDR